MVICTTRRKNLSSFQVIQEKADENLQVLHTILYGKKAKGAYSLKKNLGLFSGFIWAENEDNAALYSKVGVPFAMGTTGGDRELQYKTVYQVIHSARANATHNYGVCVVGGGMFISVLGCFVAPCIFLALLLLVIRAPKKRGFT
ncbi:hypothetical protein CASFOL_028059 [Castilleja foliolosa]|uniref:Uncharacterized protein n=1 Tax=Castilleja foliolosa TaxID=1961234 RepID=A0ABD3CEG3_9LAMI